MVQLLSAAGFAIGLVLAILLRAKRYPLRDSALMLALGSVSLLSPGTSIQFFIDLGLSFNYSTQTLGLFVLTCVELYLGYRVFRRDSPVPE